MPASVTSSYHTHNEYCDGEGHIEDMVQAALSAGLTEIGISSHAPVPFTSDWNMPVERLHDYVSEVNRLKNQYRGTIEILMGTEIDLLPNTRVEAFQHAEILPIGFDYLIGSVHYLGGGWPLRDFDGQEEVFLQILSEYYGGDVKVLVVDYFQRMRQCLDMPGLTIIGHMDRVTRWNDRQNYFNTGDEWYISEIDETLQAIARAGLIVELNTGGWRKGMRNPFPAPWVLARCKAFQIPVTLSSDAHSPHEVVADFDRGFECLAELGMHSCRLASVKSG